MRRKAPINRARDATKHLVFCVFLNPFPMYDVNVITFPWKKTIRNPCNQKWKKNLLFSGNDTPLNKTGGSIKHLFFSAFACTSCHDTDALAWIWNRTIRNRRNQKYCREKPGFTWCWPSLIVFSLLVQVLASVAEGLLAATICHNWPRMPPFSAQLFKESRHIVGFLPCVLPLIPPFGLLDNLPRWIQLYRRSSVSLRKTTRFLPSFTGFDWVSLTAFWLKIFGALPSYLTNR